jgi:hypothetical protein
VLKMSIGGGGNENNDDKVIINIAIQTPVIQIQHDIHLQTSEEY